MQELSVIMYERHPDIFAERVSELRGMSRVYYSRNSDDLYESRPVGDSGFFLETKWTSEDMIDHCRQLITRFGYSESDLQIVQRGQRQ